MRWSIIRLIWFRELRDQLRDRRTLFMIVALPVVLYPILGLLALQFALVGFTGRSTTVGIEGIDFLPPLHPTSWGFSPLPATAWLAFTPAGPGTPDLGAGRLTSAAVLTQVIDRYQDNPPLVVKDPTGEWRFPAAYFGRPAEAGRVHVVPVTEGQGPALLEARKVDLVLLIPPDLQEKINQGGRPVIHIHLRDNDEAGRLADTRILEVLEQWKERLKEVRFEHIGKPPDFDDPVEVQDPDTSRPLVELATRSIREQMIRLFPFLLVMWSLAGALYPAIDVCAGEKERGTMETLLISPASREEIVWGKFLTICVFSAATTLWNLVWMGASTWIFGRLLPQAILAPTALLWCVVSVLPLTAFFSAVCLAMGAYARSSKEGQYYLMPLFLITMPLIFLTMAPGVELNAFYSLVPITGVALMMQRLMAASRADQVPWLYFVPVLTAVVLYSGLALRWAIEQFKREEVLFREAERWDLGPWLRRLFREKEARTSAGQALFCFAVILVLRWVFFGAAGSQPVWWVRAAVGYVTFLAPPLFMALLLTLRPRHGLGLRRPAPRSLLEAMLLAVLLFLPLSELGVYVRNQLPEVDRLLNGSQAVSRNWYPSLGALMDADQPARFWWQLVLLALLASLSEELTFRGFLFSGLRRRFSPRGVIVITSFLYALYPMNAFWFLPAFAGGLVLGLFRVRGGSILPGILFAFLCRTLPAAVLWTKELGWGAESNAWDTILRPAGVAVGGVLAAGLVWHLFRQVGAVKERRSSEPPGEE